MPGYYVPASLSQPPAFAANPHVVQEGRRRLYVAPFRLGTEIAAADWFALTDGRRGKTTPSGRTTELSSTTRPIGTDSGASGRNGSIQRRQHPAGPPFAIHHSHSARISIKNTGSEHLGLAVGRDKLVFSLGEVRGNVWMTSLRQQ